MFVKPRWDDKNKRWECSTGSGQSRRWFRCKVEGEEGKRICAEKQRAYLEGPAPLLPGCLGEFVETVWWPRIKSSCTLETRRMYKGLLDKHLSVFYHRQLDDIRLEDLQPWVMGIELSAKSVHNIFGVMSGILELAHKVGRYSRKDHRLVVLPEIVKQQRQAIDIDKVKKIIEASKGSALEGPIWTAAYLGLRRNEVCGLKVPHIELGEGARVSVQDNRQACGETQKLKSKPTGQSRVLHLPRWMGEKLLSFKSPDSIYLFIADGKPIHPKRITVGMERICEAAGVERMRFHDLRHACRSNLSAAGVPEVVIMQILGHTDYQASLGYQGEQAGRQMDAFNRLASL